jgi:hypothetical protein
LPKGLCRSRELVGVLPHLLRAQLEFPLLLLKLLVREPDLERLLLEGFVLLGELRRQRRTERGLSFESRTDQIRDERGKKHSEHQGKAERVMIRFLAPNPLVEQKAAVPLQVGEDRSGAVHHTPSILGPDETEHCTRVAGTVHRDTGIESDESDRDHGRQIIQNVLLSRIVTRQKAQTAELYPYGITRSLIWLQIPLPVGEEISSLTELGRLKMQVHRGRRREYGLRVPDQCPPLITAVEHFDAPRDDQQHQHGRSKRKCALAD